VTQFYNPYHFVPCAKPTPGAVKLEDFDKGVPAHVTHAKWLATNEGKPLHHGRLVCKLTPETPLVVGAEQEEDPAGRSAKRVKPFELDGKPAIPGSSLRGLISSIAEAASNSALRVLTNSVYSYRKEMSEALSAMGIIREVKNGSDPAYELLPLALPHMLGSQRDGFRLELSLPLDPSVGGRQPPRSHGTYTPAMFRYAALKHYFGSRNARDEQDRIASRPFLDCYESPNHQVESYYRCNIPRVTLNADAFVPWAGDLYTHDANGREVLLGVSRRSEMPDVGDEGRPFNTLGIVRVLGCHDERGIPDQKHHEIFIPWPEEPIPPAAWVRIPKAVVDRFHQIADTCLDDERKETPDRELRPYHLWKTARNTSDNPNDRRFRLKTGDIVFFRPDDSGTSIAEVSISSIWRGRVETILNSGREIHPVTTWEFFARINPDLLPAGAPKKTRLTMAELMFGFVEQNKGETSRALASRVRVSNARVSGSPPRDGWYGPPITLKILGSPKPPSPAMYFGPRYLPKNQIAQAAKPNGRKFYLHHGSNPSESDWRTSQPQQNLHMKASVTPLRVNEEHKPEFWFHVDFDNLTDLELGCLLYALCPTESFRHKLGLGKPLGLGTVRIDVAGLFLTDRRTRYADDNPFSSTARYHSSWQSPLMKSAPAERYRHERGVGNQAPNVTTFRDTFRQAMVGANLNAVIEALETIGDPAKITPGVAVHYPQLNGRAVEGDHYEWFVRNDKRQRGREPCREVLRPIENGTIPTLTRHDPA